ncbi:hypothetical protein [Lentzea sp. NEAU-D7]|uniref:hypothetical protein n=1 Tax=Lentzea sp. NEAU-D7 TaxID=2994667 RepID=UPI00224AA2D9|nr:hypothetical protein [Lentzea sp. NEAU-D7]MCX2952377.1 hypothetical protein [Lentzea sp. NEAU-D7]
MLAVLDVLNDVAGILSALVAVPAAIVTLVRSRRARRDLPPAPESGADAAPEKS